MSTIKQTGVPRVIIAAAADRPVVRVSHLLRDNGLEVVQEKSLSEVLSGIKGATQHADVVFVDLDENSDEQLDLLDELMERGALPVVFSDVSQWTDVERWGRRIAAKLVNTVAEISKAETLTQTAEELVNEAAHETQEIPVPDPYVDLARDPEQRVWVLGASLGGPEVVKAFLSAVPGVPDICLILAQHIGENFAELMASQLNRVTEMEVRAARNGDKVRNGIVYIAPIEERLQINQDGVINLGIETRPRLYKPCIDYVMEEVAKRYGRQSGTIVFSGMGDDGSDGCKMIARFGGNVWAQTAETCVISSMPDCVRNTGYVSFSGSPEMLALRMVQEITLPRSEQYENVVDFKR